MSNKTEVLSFDDTLNKHKRLLTESLVNFDEGQRVRKIMLDIDSNSADYEYYFQSGQQSKQSEIDELKKRINLALKELEYIHFYRTQNSDNAIKILKGEKLNENLRSSFREQPTN